MKSIVDTKRIFTLALNQYKKNSSQPDRHITNIFSESPQKNADRFILAMTKCKTPQDVILMTKQEEYENDTSLHPLLINCVLDVCHLAEVKFVVTAKEIQNFEYYGVPMTKAEIIQLKKSELYYEIVSNLQAEKSTSCTAIELHNRL